MQTPTVTLQCVGRLQLAIGAFGRSGQARSAPAQPAHQAAPGFGRGGQIGLDQPDRVAGIDEVDHFIVTRATAGRQLVDAAELLEHRRGDAEMLRIFALALQPPGQLEAVRAGERRVELTIEGMQCGEPAQSREWLRAITCRVSIARSAGGIASTSSAVGTLAGAGRY